MEWTDEHLDMAERLGKAFMPLKDVARIFGIEHSEFVTEAPEAVMQRYDKGRLISVMEVNEAIIKQAVNGSSPAQTLAKSLIEKSAGNELG